MPRKAAHAAPAPRPARPARAGRTSHAPARYRIQAIDRAVQVLDCFDFSNTELSVKEITARTRLHKATAHRILMSLQHNGLVEQDEATSKYHLGLDLFRLGHLAVARLKLPVVARPFLERLLEQVGETAHLAVLDRGEVLYVDTLEASRALKMPGRVGHRVPTYCTSLGKALLSTMSDDQVRELLRGQRFQPHTPKTVRTIDQLLKDLSAVRARGWSLDDEEIETGLRCVGAPLMDATGEVAGAISVAAPSARLRRELIPEVAALVKSTADSISARLGYGQLREVRGLA